ncbi:MAG: alkaline phosphatase [Chitinophagaceae bacterium]|nr:alkaline phosphatase [Chitinophagaceae bacterium]
MHRYLYFLIMLWSVAVHAQPVQYSTAQVHSHNDYEQAFPFWLSWRQGFGSIEADIFLDQGELIVGHDPEQVKQRRTLDSLYLRPLLQCLQQNGGYVYADKSRQLQLMIDIKTAAIPTLDKLVQVLQNYPSLTTSPSVKIVISGNRPQPASFASYPDWIRFDGDLQKTYTPEQLTRIEMLSDNFARYSKWNGKGRLPESEQDTLQQLIKKVHTAGKKIRFWNSPDIMNSWYVYMGLGVDYINTDDINGISTFLQQLPDRVYTNRQEYSLYQPQWRNDGTDKPVKNIILIIGDGTGLPQWYAGYTANKGKLNVFNMRYTGLSKTSSYDNYITDSAPGATAFSSGTKTNNRAVGVDHTGHALTLLPEILRQKGMKTGIITSGDLRDATPAAFYAHQPERSNYKDIANDLLHSTLDIVMGSADMPVNDSITTRLHTKFQVRSSVDQLDQLDSRPLLLIDSLARRSVLNGRGDWSQKALNKSIELLSKNKAGFFLLLEGAQVDHGGHANKLPYVVTELLDLDKVIGKAMEFADSNGETLVIVTADHETGGLTLTGGDYMQGMISGQFSTGDHTALPVPVFAYGPRSYLFGGVYENTAIFRKILGALSIKEPVKSK